MDGSKMLKDIHYQFTYSPVASWPIIRMILALSLKEKWVTRQIDYELAFTQADAENKHLYMEVPKGFEVKAPDGTTSKDWVFLIKKNLYGSKMPDKFGTLT